MGGAGPDRRGRGRRRDLAPGGGAQVVPALGFYQAASSEIFGDPVEAPQNEETPVRPVTPYGAAKAYAFFIVRSYRRRYGLHASVGNPLQPRVAAASARLPAPEGGATARPGSRSDCDEKLPLGSLDARRDWGFAGDYVRAMWLMLQQEEPDDYVIATGVTHSVQDLVECAFEHVDLDWRDHVRVDESLRRGKAELQNLVGDPAKARERLGWEPTMDFDALVRMLVDADRRAADGAPSALPSVSVEDCSGTSRLREGPRRRGAPDGGRAGLQPEARDRRERRDDPTGRRGRLSTRRSS